MSSTLKQRPNAKPTGPSKTTTTTATITKQQQQQPFRLLNLLDGIGGTVNFSFFQAPSWVDLSLPPGTTSQLELNLEHPKFWDIVTGKSIVYSPNLIWILITALVYVLAPYDLEQAQDNNSWWRPDWFVRRAVLNLSVMVVYYGYWHTVLYGLHWASRPFCQGRVYKWSKLLHNVWYCVLGTLQWTAWEMIMVHLYATGRIGHQRNEEIFTREGFANFFVCAIFVPLYREIQFFFAHRVIHIRAFYKYIHALHHRNTDVEPFSGLCMSPAEHLYYISSIAPSVYWHASPFQFLWNGIHLLLSPGASHSGWEDHWHSDQFHVAHHRYFECNYGTPDMPLDRWFGCFRETMAPTTRVYVGDADECKSKPSVGSVVIMARVDAKSTLFGLPSWDQMVYMAVTAIGLPLFVIHVASLRDNVSVNPWYGQATIAAFIVSVGPLILAALLSTVTAGSSIWSSKEKWQSTLLYPFHKESLWGRFGITLFMGTILSILPTFHFFHSLFVPNPNDTIYNQIWK